MLKCVTSSVVVKQTILMHSDVQFIIYRYMPKVSKVLGHNFFNQVSYPARPVFKIGLSIAPELEGSVVGPIIILVKGDLPSGLFAQL